MTHVGTHLEGTGDGTSEVEVSWALDVGAENGTEDTFNEDEGEVPDELLLETRGCQHCTEHEDD